MHTILVYGTLRPFKNTEIVKIPGYIYDLGAFPGFKRLSEATDSVVTCERITADDTKLASLDRYEGYYKDSPNNSLYLREKMEDKDAPGGWSWIYVYNHDVEDSRLIEHGDWQTHMEEKV